MGKLQGELQEIEAALLTLKDFLDEHRPLMRRLLNDSPAWDTLSDTAATLMAAAFVAARKGNRAVYSGMLGETIVMFYLSGYLRCEREERLPTLVMKEEADEE